jgi:hypothetical protein
MFARRQHFLTCSERSRADDIGNSTIYQLIMSVRKSRTLDAEWDAGKRRDAPQKQ